MNKLGIESVTVLTWLKMHTDQSKTTAMANEQQLALEKQELLVHQSQLAASMAEIQDDLALQSSQLKKIYAKKLKSSASMAQLSAEKLAFTKDLELKETRCKRLKKKLDGLETSVQAIAKEIELRNASISTNTSKLQEYPIIPRPNCPEYETHLDCKKSIASTTNALVSICTCIKLRNL